MKKLIVLLFLLSIVSFLISHLSFLTVYAYEYDPFSHWYEELSFDTDLNTTGITFEGDYARLEQKTEQTWTQTTAEDFSEGTISTFEHDEANPANTNVPSIANLDGTLQMMNQILWQYGQTDVPGAGFNQLGDRGGGAGVSQARRLSDNAVLIVDVSNYRVIEVNNDHEITWQYGTTGVSGRLPNQIRNPRNAEVNGEVIGIADYWFADSRFIEVRKSDYNPALPDNGFTAGSIVRTCPINVYGFKYSSPNTIVGATRDSRTVVEYDLSTCSIIWQYGDGTSGNAINQLVWPYDASKLSDGNILITDKNGYRVFVVRYSDYDPLAPNFGFTENSIIWQYGVAGVSGTGINYLSNLEAAIESPSGDIIISDRWHYEVIEVKNSDYNASEPNNGFTKDSIIWKYGGSNGTGFNQLSGANTAIRNEFNTTLIADNYNARVIEVGYPADTTAIYTSSLYDNGDNTLRKYFTNITVKTKELPTDVTLEIQYSIDEGPWISAGIIASPTHTQSVFPFTEGTIGKTIRYRALFRTHNHYHTPKLDEISIGFYSYETQAVEYLYTKEDKRQGTFDGTILLPDGTIGSDINWENRLSIADSLAYTKSVEYNDELYILGGYYYNNSTSTRTYFNNLRRYNSSTNVLTDLSPFSTGRMNQRAVIIGDKIYMLGGYYYTTTTVYLYDLQEYDISTDTWSTKSSFPQRNPGTFEPIVVNGKIYVIGGSVSTYYNTILEYDPSTDVWTTKATTLSQPRGYGQTVEYNNQIYIIGGIVGGSIGTMVEKYDPATDTIETLSPLPYPAYYGEALLIGGKIYYYSYGLATLQIYDIDTDSWTAETSPYTYGHSSIGYENTAVINNNKILFLGRNSTTGLTLRPILYNIDSKTWGVLGDRASQISSGNEYFYINNTILEIGGITTSSEYVGTIYSAEGVIDLSTYTIEMLSDVTPDDYKIIEKLRWDMENATGEIELFYNLDGTEWHSAGTSGEYIFDEPQISKSIFLRALFRIEEDKWNFGLLLENIKIDYRTYRMSGYIQSPLIETMNLTAWKEIQVEETLTENTMIYYDILDLNGNEIPGFINLRPNSPIDISDLSTEYQAIYLRARFTTDSISETPRLYSWGVYWEGTTLPSTGKAIKLEVLLGGLILSTTLIITITAQKKTNISLA